MLVEGEPGGEPLHHLLLPHPSRSLSGSVPQGGAEKGQQGGPLPRLHPLPAQAVAMTTAAQPHNNSAGPSGSQMLSHLQQLDETSIYHQDNRIFIVEMMVLV